MKKNKILISIIIISMFWQACKKDADLPKLPEPINEPEVITSLILTFTDSANKIGRASCRERVSLNV